MYFDRISARRVKNRTNKRRSPVRDRVLSVETLEKRAMLTTVVPHLAPHIAIVTPPDIGILTLDPSASGSVIRSGDGSITVTNGDIVIDSGAKQASQRSGDGNIQANNIYVHGNIFGSGSGRYIGNVVTSASQMADPFATLPVPTQPSPNYGTSTINNKTVTLQPGTYSNLTLNNSRVTLAPGLYYFTGSLTMSGSSLSGTGVTIFLRSGAFTESGSSSVNLSAPTSGTYQDVVFFQNRTDGQNVTISGNATATFTGLVYASDALFNLSGNGNRYIDGDNGPEVLNGSLVVKDLLVSGDGSLIVATNASGFSGDLSITKTDNVGGSSITSSIGAATPGGTIVYTITVTNSGPSPALGATVSDVFPSAITSDTYTVAASGGASDITHPASGSGSIADTVNLPSGGTIVYTVTASISASAIGSMTNTATVTPPATFIDTNLSNNSASDTDNFLMADLAITKTDNDGGSSITPSTGNVTAGTAVTYTIVVTNNGPNAVTGANASDFFPSNITSDTFSVGTTGGASDTTNAASGSGNINDSVNMPVGSTITYTVTANISPAATGTLSNTATVTPPTGVSDPNLANNTATDNDTIQQVADLAITKTDNDGGSSIIPSVGAATAGTTITYTIIVTNNGPSNVTGAALADLFTTNPNITSDTFTVSTTGGAADTTNPTSGSGNIIDMVNMPTGSTITYTVTASISANASGTLTNSAAVNPPSGVTDSNLSNNQATDTDTLFGEIQ